MVDSPFIVPEGTAKNLRLDKWLSTQLSDLSRSRIQQLIAEGHVTQNGANVTDASRKVKPCEAYHVTIPATEPLDLTPILMELDVVYEDKDLLVINKAAGISVHPSSSSDEPTLVHGLLAHCGDSLSGIGGVARPGIVHRIDKDTSGLLIVAKNDAAHQHLSNQLKDRTLSRTYQAICWGVPQPMQGAIEGAIGRSPSNRKKMAVVKSGGKDAKTHYTVKKLFTSQKGQETIPIAALIRCQLESGRTHQIRVHLTHIGHPLIGDPVYGGNNNSKVNKLDVNNESKECLLSFNRQALHAHTIQFSHPTQGVDMSFTIDIPNDMKTLIKHLHT